MERISVSALPPCNLGSAAVADDEFVASFEACSYPNQAFHHPDHLRLAWIYLRRFGAPSAEERMCASIIRFAGSLGHAAKYHETMTRAWVRLVDGAARLTPAPSDFVEFIQLHPWLLERNVLGSFFSPELMGSDAAKHGWVQPDLAPIPFSCAGR